MRRIVISGPQPVDMLDVAGPLEVFKLASKYEVILVSSGLSASNHRAKSMLWDFELILVDSQTFDF